MKRMSRPLISAIVVVVLTGAFAACESDTSKSGRPSSPAAAPDARKVDSATAAKVSGKVVLEGAPPPAAAINMASDPACTANSKGDVRSDGFVVDSGGLKNVFVYIKDGLGNKYIFDTPTESVKLDQKGCHYVPHVLGIRTTQPLEVINSDNTMHNIHGMPQANREFNFAQM